MKGTKRTKLVYELILFLLPLLVLSLVISSVVLSWTSYNYSLKTVRQDYGNIIKSVAGEIRLHVESAKQELVVLAQVMAAVKMDPWQKEISLVAFNHTATQFMSVSLIGSAGRRIVTTSLEEEAAEYGHNDVFQRALRKETAVSDVMRTNENIPYARIAVPVVRLGEVTEVLWGELNLKSVWDVLEGINVGQTGHVFITDASGRIIGHREIDLVVRGARLKSAWLLERIRKADVPVEWAEEENGRPVYRMGYSIPGLDWTIVLCQEESEIYGNLYENIRWAVLITVLACLAAVLLGLHQVRRFLIPIQDLHRQVQLIGEGNLDHKVDVTTLDEIGDLGLAFNQMTESLKQFIGREVETAKELVHNKNLAVLGAASSKVTHEVGNLLNNIGMTLAALKGETLSPRGQKTLEIMENDSRRVREFIKNFLQFAKKPELRLERQQMDGIIREILFVQRPEAEKREIRLELNWPADLPAVNLDGALMYQAVNNLMKNALEAMTEPGEIRVSGEREGEHLVVSIADTGPGIAPEVREQIFEPFFTTKGKKGTGLGLAIVKTVIEAHRGVIECRSNPGEGTTFVLRLPLQ